MERSYNITLKIVDILCFILYKFIMNKLLILLTALTLVEVWLVGCNKESSHFTGEWKFAERKVVSVL